MAIEVFDVWPGHVVVELPPRGEVAIEMAVYVVEAFDGEAWHALTIAEWRSSETGAPLAAARVADA
jgi:hypothetical protein